MRTLLVAACLVVLVPACGSADSPSSPGEPAAEELPTAVASTPAPATPPPPTAIPAEAETEELFPDVLDVVASQTADGSWNFDVTLSSPYDSPQRYADAWRVLDPDGNQLGVRELAHDHAGEQPFTRSLGGVEIPEGVNVVTIEGRDQVSGWGGATFDLAVS